MTALTVLSIGALTPVLPVAVTASALLLSGSILVALGAGANLASATQSSKKTSSSDDQPNRTNGYGADASQGNSAPVSNYMQARQRHAGKPPHSGRSKPENHKASAIDPNHDWADLMARINHELRTPLNAVIGFSEVMSLEMFGPIGNERYQDYLRHINDSAGELLKSAEDTLALTALLTNHRDAVVREVCTLHQAVVEAWAFVERKATVRNIRIEYAIGAEIEVLNEPRALRQIFVNLLSEAIARTEDDHTISLVAIPDGELIEVVATVRQERTEIAARNGSLAITLARTLLEMQGTSLLEIKPATGGWTAVTVLDRAAQEDLFASRRATVADNGHQARRYA
ncbi:histidine kinase dimerization/phospho-acceptor domain-containing protein [Hyphomicrobium sulfonivorans]|uniref:histidine kinase dimerization/phospho-acceptor domain-containing protein n=1 Tax=Hyphomicrobium sulfonivorans TaxID=121290 RepID=UPI00156F297F|nr:HAMP domain-containing histidine kinase [Hyphomicrobium sulfonivorans]